MGGLPPHLPHLSCYSIVFRMPVLCRRLCGFVGDHDHVRIAGMKLEDGAEQRREEW